MQNRRGNRGQKPRRCNVTDNSNNKELPAHPASIFLHHISELRPGDTVVLLACVSWPDRKANLSDQLANLRQHAEARNGIIVGTHRLIGQRYCSKWIRKALRKLNRLGADWLLAETSDRFARSRLYDCIANPNAQAGAKLLRKLQQLTGDRLMTVLSPDATNSEIRSFQRRRGQQFKGNFGGRPLKIRYKSRYHKSPEIVEKVLRLRDRDVSWRRIAEIIGRSQSTIRGWYARRRPK